MPEIPWLFLVAGLIGGAVNAAAGGAKLFVFPLLIASGLPPLVANATGTVAVWPAQLPAAWVYRRELGSGRRRLLLLLLPALAGAFVGALALINSTEDAFVAVVPALLLLAVGSILLGPRAVTFARRILPGGRQGLLSALLLFGCGLYGGYFGAGLGFMLLAALSLAEDAGLQRANAGKNLFAFLMNTTAVVPLALSGLVDWLAAGSVLVGGVAGGYFGARVIRGLPERPLRIAIGVLGVVLTLSFLFRS